jgi:hypothetical protein
MAGGHIRVRQRNSGTVRLPAGGVTDTMAEANYLDGGNTEVSPSTATFETTGFAGGGASTQPAPCSSRPITAEKPCIAAYSRRLQRRCHLG